MWRNKFCNLLGATLVALLAALVLGALTLSTVLAGEVRSPEGLPSPDDVIFTTPRTVPSPKNTLTPTPDPTNAINLPMVQQEAPYQTSTPTSEPPTPTETVIFIPPQPPIVNAPIVVGATVIVAIIVLAWVFVGKQPLNKAE